ncbi:MAG: hypothetical protein ACM3XS_05190, partial [Bacteroidota bacterium]
MAPAPSTAAHEQARMAANAAPSRLWHVSLPITGYYALTGDLRTTIHSRAARRHKLPTVPER